MKELNYNIDDFNSIFNNSFPNQLINIYVGVIFGDDFDFLQFVMFDNYF